MLKSAIPLGSEPLVEAEFAGDVVEGYPRTEVGEFGFGKRRFGGLAK